MTSAPRPDRRPRRGTSIATRLAGAVVFVGLVSLVIATIVGLGSGRELADDLVDQRLRSTVESAAFDVDSEIDSSLRAAEALAASPQAVAAIERFAAGVDELDQVDPTTLDEQTDALIEDYREAYLEPLRAAGRDVVTPDIVDDSAAAIHLQYEYAIDTGVATPAGVIDADDGSAWTEVHRIVHPIYRDVVLRLDAALDLYLVDASGRIVYSVSKRPDLATNLNTGPFSGSVVANTFRRVRDDPDHAAHVSDLNYYDAIPAVPVGVVAAAVLDDSEFVGALMVVFDGARITELVTADQAWEAAGLPESSDVYVIGADGLLRSDPRTYLEAPTAHLQASQAEGHITADERATIEAIGTTVLLQRSVDATRDAALDADESVASRDSMVGDDVLSIVVPARDDGVQWFVVTEVSSVDADRDLDEFQELLIVGAAIFVVALAFVAVAWAAGIARPIRTISDRIVQRDRRSEPIEVPPGSPVEIQLLASNLDVMGRDLGRQQDQIATARRERLDLLRSMLPPSVADRIASGELRTLEQAPAATVVVVVVLGLSDLVRSDSSRADRELVDDLHAELDQLAAEHGVDRIKVVGDAYYAVCGHDRQYIDHAPRAVAFAREAATAIRDIETDVNLELAVGIASGAVTTGMAGGARLVYDVWGVTVSRAHLLARQARGGEILVSAETRALLPESIASTPVDGDDAYLVAAEEVAP